MESALLEQPRLGRAGREGPHGQDLAGDLIGLAEELPERLAGRAVPAVLAVTATATSLGMLLSEPHPDPADGFEAVDGGLTWLIDRSVIGVEAGAGWAGSPWPLLVTLGRLPADGPVVLANLAALGVIGVAGDPGDVAALMESLAAELAGSPFAEGFTLLCVDCAHELRGHEGVRVVPRLGAVLAELEHTAASRGERRRPRRRGGLLLLDPHTRDAPVREHLQHLAGDGLVAVTAVPHRPAGAEPAAGAGHGVSWRLEIDADRLRWEPPGVDLRRVEPLLRLPGGLPAVRRDRSRAGAAPRPALSASPTHRRHDPLWPGSGASPPAAGDDRCAPASYAVAAGVRPGPVDLQVLGVVRAVGAAVAFTSQRALDLVCYLAFHREGANSDRLKHWLWRSEAVPSCKSFANVVSRARVCLGRDAAGAPYLSRLGPGGVYRLSGLVTTDVQRFTAWLAAAERAQPRQALDCLHRALALVRGVPLSGGRGDAFAWADMALRTHVEYLVDDTAHRLGDAALEAGRLDIARWATWQGLAVVPGCDRCYELRYLAAHLSGSRSERYAAMRQLQRVKAEPAPGLGDLDGLGAELDRLLARQPA